MSESPEVEVCFVYGQRVKGPGQICNLGKGKELEMKAEKDWVPGGQPCRPQ